MRVHELITDSSHSTEHEHEQELSAEASLLISVLQGIKDVERATAACSECLNIQAVLARVEEMEGIKIWKENRPDTKF